LPAAAPPLRPVRSRGRGVASNQSMSNLAKPVTAEDHAQGPSNAPVTLVEYGDYQCPSCGDAFPIVKQLQEHFGERLRFVFRNYPLPQHPYAEHAAEAAEFAASHGKFWEMHDLLYGHQSNLRDAELLRLAKHAGLKPEELTEALERDTYEARVQADVESGDASGVQGTPSFYINGREHAGDYDFESLVEAIEEAG
jgi:protein-disulfide isomerase